MLVSRQLQATLVQRAALLTSALQTVSVLKGQSMRQSVRLELLLLSLLSRRTTVQQWQAISARQAIRAPCVLLETFALQGLSARWSVLW